MARLPGYLNSLSDSNVSVVQDISGNVPVGEQYNDFMIGDNWGVVYNSIGVTPEAYYITPFGDFNVPNWFVEAVGRPFSSRLPHGWRGCLPRHCPPQSYPGWLPTCPHCCRRCGDAVCPDTLH